MILHTLNKAQSAIALNQQLSNTCSKQDSVLLIEDGVYQLLTTTPEETHWFNNAKQIYALSDDADSRGINHLEIIENNSRVSFVSYQEFVALCASHSNTISWY